MRFMSRNAPQNFRPSPGHDVEPPLGDSHHLANAGPFIKVENNRKWRTAVEKKPPPQDTFKHLPNEERRHLDNLTRAHDALLDTRQAFSNSIMPVGRNTSVCPDVEVQTRSAHHLLHPSRPPRMPARKPSANATPRRAGSRADLSFGGLFDSIERDHYEPSKQPWSVSQQTSASAVRDMALRKGAPMIHETSSDPTLMRHAMKSAMKIKRKDAEVQRSPDDLHRSRTNEGREKPARRMNFSQLFPSSRGDSGRSQSPKLHQSVSTLTVASEFFPQETVHAQLSRPAGNARFETLKHVKSPSIDSDSTTRAKVLEPDVLASTKRNVRRPPKGIQNWFDGFIISSDEDSEPEPQELPANEALPSTFTQWVTPEKKPANFDRKASRDPVEDNILAIEHAKERIQERLRMGPGRKDSVDLVTLRTADSATSSPMTNRRIGGEGRMATSRLARSILSLSSSEEEEPTDLPSVQGSLGDFDDVVEDVAPTDSRRPATPHRQLHSKRSLARESSSRQSASTTQKSGSIAMSWAHKDPMPDIASRMTHTSDPELTEKAPRKLSGDRDSKVLSSLSRRSTKISAHVKEGNLSSEIAGGVLSDSSHMMAVTEEEMILLEMMRQKRAAMQKDSFAEGYQLALKREQEHLARRRESAQQTAMKILRQKDERAAAKSHRTSRIESIADPEQRQQRKYGAVRKEDVDRALRLERFLRGVEAPMEDAFPSPPAGDRLSEEAPSAPQRFDLLLPDTYSPTPSRLDKHSNSAGDSSSLKEEDLEEHHNKIRAFLASSVTPNSAHTFPRPPSSVGRTEGRHRKRKSTISPTSLEEEDETTVVPALPSRSPHRLLAHETEARRKSIRGRSLSNQISVEPLVELAPPLLEAKGLPHDHYNPDNLLPNLDFSPVDYSLPDAAGTGLSSLSASRASPLSPDFLTTATPSDKTTIDTPSSDNASQRGRTYTPDTDLTSLSASVLSPASSRRRRPPRAPLPSRLDAVASPAFNQRLSMNSITSASEDVLAAWKELGGGSDAFASRRTRAR